MVKMYYECIANTFNRELFCCKKKKKRLQWGSCQPCFKHIFGVQMKIDKQCKRQSLSEPNSWKPEGISIYKLSLRSYNQLSLHACLWINIHYITIYVYQFSFELWTTLVKSDKSGTRFCLSVWYIEWGGGGLIDRSN